MSMGNKKFIENWNSLSEFLSFFGIRFAARRAYEPRDKSGIKKNMTRDQHSKQDMQHARS